MGVPKDEFKKKYPKLFDAIKSNQKRYEIYGIEFMSHTPLTLMEIKSRVEDPRAKLYYKFNTIDLKENCIILN